MQSISSPTLVGISFWLLTAVVAYILYLRYLAGLRHISGPFIASFSNWWKIKAAWQEQMPQQNIALHKKYGPLVRIGPNMISVDDPAAMNIIYGFKSIYHKVSLSTIHRDLDADQHSDGFLSHR